MNTFCGPQFYFHYFSKKKKKSHVSLSGPDYWVRTGWEVNKMVLLKTRNKRPMLRNHLVDGRGGEIQYCIHLSEPLFGFPLWNLWNSIQNTPLKKCVSFMWITLMSETFKMLTIFILTVGREKSSVNHASQEGVETEGRQCRYSLENA